jgi:hypothetical protein
MVEYYENQCKDAQKNQKIQGIIDCNCLHISNMLFVFTWSIALERKIIGHIYYRQDINSEE